MRKDKIAYYHVSPYGIGHWKPGKAARKAGFSNIVCGPDGPNAWAIAREQNNRWQATRTGAAPIARTKPRRGEWRLQWEIDDDAISYPAGSIGTAFQAFRRTTPWRRDKARTTRTEYGRIWSHLKVYATVDPKTLTLEMLSDWRDDLEDRTSNDLAWRGIKIFRAIWVAMAGLKYCRAGEDPSKAIRNRAPKGRAETWNHGEVVRLVKQAWRMDFHGLACIVAIAWDSQLSVGDVRKLTAADRRDDGDAMHFEENRSKTGRPFLATVTAPTAALVRHHLASASPVTPDAGLLFLTRRGAPYRKNSCAKDFRTVRAALFGEDEQRQLRDARRSGTHEARAGGAAFDDIGAKMANGIAGNRRLQQTYSPHEMDSIHRVDAARKVGRKALRKNSS